jgi:LacI family transcriptional regulator
VKAKFEVYIHLLGVMLRYMPRSLPVSLRDVANIAGVSRMAASYALRNSPKIPLATRAKIQAAAKKLGYVPDARMVIIMSGVRAAKSREPVPLAWLNTDPKKEAYHRLSYLTPYFEGAKERCYELGYRLEEVWLRDPGIMTARRVSRVLYTRGIVGVIIAPATNRGIEHLRLDWKHFGCVSFENALVAPKLHRVAPDYFRNMLMALQRLRRQGYRRIGICIHKWLEQRSLHAYLGALGYFHSTIKPEERIIPHLYEWSEMDAPRSHFRVLFNWLQEQRPDAIVCQHSKMIEWLTHLDFKVPQDIGVAHLAVDDDVKDWSGIWQQKREIGAATVEIVTSLVTGNRLGLPAVAHNTLITGRWNSGKTVRLIKR